MIKILLTFLLITTIYATPNNETNATSQIPWNTLLKMANDVNSSELYKMGSKYIDEINTQENRDKAVAFYEKSKEKISSFSVESITNIACENNQSNEKQCSYWKNQEKLSINASQSNNEFCSVNSLTFTEVKATDIKMQELEALFIGLCQKVKQGDLTSNQAEAILQTSKDRLLK